MVLKGYRLWVMGQLDSNVQSPTAAPLGSCSHAALAPDHPTAPPLCSAAGCI
jgi:hypothetical protein